MDTIERARLYLSKAGPAISGSGGHTHTLMLARALVRGFNFSASEALGLLSEWNQCNSEKWSQQELNHKIQSALNGAPPPQGEGWLVRDDDRRGPRASVPAVPAYVPPPAVNFSPDALRKFAGEWAGVANLKYLAERSSVDPATVSSSAFLDALYRREAGEKVLVFTSEYSQGEAVWPDDAVLPAEGPCGVWFLCQPVDGKYRPAGVTKKGAKENMSRRVGECLMAWRYLVVESDEASARDWLGALVQMPLRIAAIYTSGSRSLHALVRVDARSKAGWDAEKAALRSALVLLGADPGAMSGVRLSRLPGCLRLGKFAPLLNASGEPLKDEQGRPRKKYVRWETPGEQKLLYLQPEPFASPICELPRRRDLVSAWAAVARSAMRAGDVEAMGRIVRAGEFYKRVSPELRAMSVEAASLIGEMRQAGQTT